MAIAAHFERSPATRRQRELRRKLLFDAQGIPASGGPTGVLVHNISASGLLLQCAAPLRIGEDIEIELPEAGLTSARIVWASGQLFGCRFEAPISSAALSAAQLRSAVAGEVDLPSKRAGETTESFAARLARLRKASGLTLAEIAAGLDVSKPTVWAWEKGRAQPIEERIEALAGLLGVDTTELLTERDDTALQDLLAESRERIARALGTSPAKVRIFIEP